MFYRFSLLVHRFSFFVLLSFIFFTVYLTGFHVVIPRVFAESVLTEDELGTLVRPSVVRVLHRLNGEIIFKPVDLDIKTFSFKPAKGEDKKFPLENYDIYGTGFFINSNGYLITNAHVVSLKSVQIEAAVGYTAGLMVKAAGKAKLSEKESNAFLERILAFSDEEKEKFRNDILNYVKVVATSTVVVVRPGENSDSKFDVLFEKGYPASIVSLSEEFMFNDRDFAVLKIDKKNTPSLLFGASEGLADGKRGYLIGFPQTAEADGLFLTDKSTFTSGLITSQKPSAKKDFSIFQTDAKISQGSSGSPFFNLDGKVIGVVSFQSEKEDLNSGDQFAFAIPISIVLGVLDSEKITNNEGEFQRITRLAFQEKSLKHCKKSLALFEEAKNTVDVDFHSNLNLKPYLDECNGLIASGGSIDTKWDEWGEKIKNADTSTILLIVGGGLLSIILLVAVVLLVKRSRKEEKKMHTLEDTLVRNHVSQSQVGVQPTSVLSSVPAQPQPISSVAQEQGPVVPPKIKEYVDYRVGQGATKALIIEELRKAGWDASVIQKAVLG